MIKEEQRERESINYIYRERLAKAEETKIFQLDELRNVADMTQTEKAKANELAALKSQYDRGMQYTAGRRTKAGKCGRKAMAKSQTP